MDTFLTIKEVCAKIKISRQTLRSWINKRTFPNGIRPGGKKLIWEESIIKEWVLKHRETNI